MGFRLGSGFQSVEGLIEAIGLDPEKLCTYCWTGKGSNPLILHPVHPH